MTKFAAQALRFFALCNTPSSNNDETFVVVMFLIRLASHLSLRSLISYYNSRHPAQQIVTTELAYIGGLVNTGVVYCQGQSPILVLTASDVE